MLHEHCIDSMWQTHTTKTKCQVSRRRSSFGLFVCLLLLFCALNDTKLTETVRLQYNEYNSAGETETINHCGNNNRWCAELGVFVRGGRLDKGASRVQE